DLRAHLLPVRTHDRAQAPAPRAGPRACEPASPRVPRRPPRPADGRGDGPARRPDRLL
ncbi:MAG: hypothetical protein AVDCRST_MAG47-591, partial [uncultured Nocardioidaceae bacterium]